METPADNTIFPGLFSQQLLCLMPHLPHVAMIITDASIIIEGHARGTLIRDDESQCRAMEISGQAFYFAISASNCAARDAIIFLESRKQRIMLSPLTFSPMRKAQRHAMGFSPPKRCRRAMPPPTDLRCTEATFAHGQPRDERHFSAESISSAITAPLSHSSTASLLWPPVRPTAFSNGRSYYLEYAELSRRGAKLTGALYIHFYDMPPGQPTITLLGAPPLSRTPSTTYRRA